MSFLTRARKTRSIGFPKFSLFSHTKRGVAAGLLSRNKWLDSALLIPPTKITRSDSKKGVRDQTFVEMKLMGMWLGKYPSLLRVPIELDFAVNTFLGAHPLQWVVSEQKSLFEKSKNTDKQLTWQEAFELVEEKLKSVMNRRHLAQRIQASQAQTLGARPGFQRWAEVIDWTQWATRNLEWRDSGRLLVKRQRTSSVILSDQWDPILKLVKLRSLEVDEFGSPQLIKTEDLSVEGIDEVTVIAFLELYPQYISFFEESITLRLAGDSIPEAPEFRDRIVSLLRLLNTEQINSVQFREGVETMEHELKALDRRREKEELESLVPALERVTIKDPFDEGFISTAAVSGAAENLKLLFKDIQKRH